MSNLFENNKVLGDYHNGQAAKLIKEGNRIFIRKPKSASTELAFKAFIKMLSENGFLYVPGTVDIIKTDQNEHDVKIIVHQQVESIEKASDFYKRTGSMLFFLYVFSGSDFHCENIIANGEYPTIVDYEMLMSGKEHARYKPIYNSLVESVLGTHFLPNWKIREHRIFEVSGLSGGPDNNILYCKGKPTFAYDYIDDIIYGFKYAYSFCVEKPLIIKRGIELFKDCNFRVIVRPTATYLKVASLLEDLPVEDKTNKARILLSRAYDKNFDKEHKIKASGMLEAEMVSVVQGEAPLFYVKGSGTDLFFRRKNVYSDYLKLSPVDNAIKKLDSLTYEMVVDQIKIIKQSVETIRPISRKKHSEIDNRSLDCILFDTLESMSISFLPTGWLQLFEDKGCPFIDGIGTGLYDGMLGILCCYGALYYKTAKQEYLDALLKRYNPYHDYGIPDRLEMNSINVSLQEGVAGQIQALQHLYDLTGDDIFLYDAKKLLHLISEGVKEKGFPKGDLDILSGYASLAVALSGFSEDNVKDIALYLKDMMVKHNLRLTGFGHGMAGESLAVAVIGHILNTHDLDDRIIFLLQEENKYYSEEIHNWKDLRSPDGQGGMMGWCSGAPGIGIARKKLSLISDNPEIQYICEQDIQRTKIHLQGYRYIKRDSLCCGNAARLMAASRLNIRLDYLYKYLEKKLRENRLEIFHMLDSCDINMGLMQGYSGVGYALLMYGDNKSGDMLL